MLRSRRSCFALVAATAVTCAAASSDAAPPSYDAYFSEGPAAAPLRLGTAATAAFVASHDDRRGVPTFLWAAQDGQPDYAALGPAEAARRHLTAEAARYGLERSLVDAAEVATVHDLGHGGIVVTFRQRVRDVEVFRVAAKVLLTRQHRLVAIAGNLHAAARPELATGSFALDARGAVAAALGDLYSTPLVASEVVDLKQDNGPLHFYGLALGPALAATGPELLGSAGLRRIWFALPDRLVPAYYLEMLAREHPGARDDDAYAYAIAADDGRVLYRASLERDAEFAYRVWADPAGNHRPFDGPLADYSPHPIGTPDGSYPGFVAPNLVTADGFNSFADPWLDPGAVETRGNNVDAYTDDDAPDGFSAGDLRATTTAPGVFDRTFDTSQSPLASDEQRMAAVTSVFYLVNWFHDDWYDSGFDEAAGNAQVSNYGRGGLGNDALRAQAQDGAPGQTDNANMSTFADGMAPRLQIFLWSAPSTTSVTVQPLNQTYQPGVAGFGPSSFAVTANVVLADDGTAPVSNACEPIQNDVTGAIALIDRGTCTFKQKAVYAEAAGAVGVILVNNQAGNVPPDMPDGNPPGPVGIPMLSVTLSEGNAVKAALANGPVTATLTGAVGVLREGDIDATLVAHELGHYLHLRLVACGQAQCSAESEGWGDFVAMHQVLRPGDDPAGTYALTPYAAGAMADPAYFGLRRYPYSTSLGANPLTFGHITSGAALPGGPPQNPSSLGVDNAEVHNAGEVWSAMLFQGYGGMLVQANGPNPPYDADQARRRMADYVVAGMKLAPENPTFTEQRDALLAAAFAADPSDMLLLAQGFATRGAGSCAVSPARDSTDFAGVVESFALQPDAVIVATHLDDSVSSCDGDGRLDAFEQGKLVVEVMNGGVAPLTGATLTIDAGASGLTLPNGSVANLGDLAPLAHATVSFDAELAPAPTDKAQAAFTVTLAAPNACQTSLTLTTGEVVNADEVAEAATTDDVEPAATAWSTDGDGGDVIWSRFAASVGDHVWHAVDFGAPSDTALVSPPLVVGSTALTLQFSQRYAFEASNGTNYDGGVIEISTDGGTSWQDIGTYGDPGYTGQIGDFGGGATNVLKGRQGYVAESPAWPAMATTTVDLGTALAGQTVRVRFRIATDDAVGAAGWDIDDVAFEGLTNTPFPALVADAGSCFPPVADAGPDQSVASAAPVALDGSASHDDDGGTLAFAWQQTDGPPVTLASADGPTPTFTAPAVAVATTLRFTLSVSDGTGTDGDSVDVVVTPPGAEPSEPVVVGGGCGCELAGAPTRGGAHALGWLALGAGLLARRRRR
ncbi:MAG: M36 family metallopeptidase [Myxococcales bacterium]|nr:M36 family metallopeptidase [Myxococcales bacterium]